MLYDVVVVGAGPGGATAAEHLARHGVRTLLIEKGLIPRQKVCAGGLSPSVSAHVEVDYSGLVERVVRRMVFSFPGEPAQTREIDGVRIEMVTRSRFDQRLVEAAVSSGAELVDGKRVAGVEEGPNEVALQCAGGDSFRAAIVVGADGAFSCVARAVGLVGPPPGIAIEGELVPADASAPEEFGDRLYIALGAVDSGYGWVFPKRDHFSVGVGSTLRRPSGLREAYERLKGHFAFLAGARELGRRGWPLPVHRAARPLNTARVCLVGDAASLVDPLTGEGIPTAISSGSLAAEVIANELDRSGCLSGRYSRKVRDRLADELLSAGRLAGWSMRWQGGLARSGWAFSLFARRIRDHYSYRQLLSEANSHLAEETSGTGPAQQACNSMDDGRS